MGYSSQGHKELDMMQATEHAHMQGCFKIVEYVDICNDGLRANTTGQAVEGRILQGVGEGRFLVVEQEHVGALLHDAGQCADTSREGKEADT